MKRIILVFGLIFSLVSFKANAGTPTNAEKAHNQTLKMTKVLSLSADQQTAVEALLLSKLNEVDAINADETKDGAAKEKALEQLKTERDARLAEILTPTQYSTYLHEREVRQQRHNSVR